MLLATTNKNLASLTNSYCEEVSQAATLRKECPRPASLFPLTTHTLAATFYHCTLPPSPPLLAMLLLLLLLLLPPFAAASLSTLSHLSLAL